MTGQRVEILEDARTLVAEYLAARVGRSENGCLEWTLAPAGRAQGQGEGRAMASLPTGVLVGDIRHVYAYRLAYALHVGPVPKGLVICHRCDNGLCVDVDHLFLGTLQDNALDMVRKGRHPGIGIKYGVEHHMVNRPDDLVQQVRDAWEAGEFSTYTDLGRAFGLSKGTARDWAIGRSRNVRTPLAVPEHICKDVDPSVMPETSIENEHRSAS